MNQERTEVYDASMELGPTAVHNPVEGLFSETASRKGRQIGSTLNSAMFSNPRKHPSNGVLSFLVLY